MSEVKKSTQEAGRGNIPRALALCCGMIAFLITVLLGLLAGERPATAILRAAVAGIALGAFASVLGALGIQVVREALEPPRPVPERSPAAPDPSAVQDTVQDTVDAPGAKGREEEQRVHTGAGPPGEALPSAKAGETGN